MTSKEHLFENLGDPIEPSLDSIGRSIADRWVIRALILRLICFEDLIEVAAMINQYSADVQEKVGRTLELELQTANDQKFNSRVTHEDCEDRIKYIVDEIKTMRKAIQEESDEQALLFGEPVQASR